MNSPLPPIGFIGLGMMGAPMAARLHSAGYRLVVGDASPAATQAFCARHPGTTTAAGPDTFGACAVIITMLPDSDAVESVLLGAPGREGVAATLQPGALIVDMSSSQPLRTRGLSETLRQRGLRFLDAPVSGGVKRAIDGSLAIMVGGDAEAFESARGILSHLGRTLTHVGAAGAGHAMKALNNYVSAAGLVATVEALHAGRRFGLDPAVMTDVLNSSTGKNNTTENKVKPFMLSGAFNSGFSLALMAKDLGIAMGLATAIGSDLRLGHEVLAMWSTAAEQLGNGADHTEMYRWLGPPPQ
jgi:3-hydroxyisobutyrate dehydrogenase